MHIHISSDHGGFNLKAKLLTSLKSQGLEVTDLGPFEYDPLDDYPDYGIPLATKVVEERKSGEEVFGILLCRSGNGMVIAANKVKGALAALCFTPSHAKQAREHDHANIIVLDSEYSDSNPEEIVMEFVNATELDGKYQRRVDKIKEYENTRV